MIRPIVWMVVWVDGDGLGHGSCGHRHASSDEATACPWEPAGLPAIGAGLVREVRDPMHVTRGQELAIERDRPTQLELWGLA